jgi:hypothetical protein
MANQGFLSEEWLMIISWAFNLTIGVGYPRSIADQNLGWQLWLQALTDLLAIYLNSVAIRST